MDDRLMKVDGHEEGSERANEHEKRELSTEDENRGNEPDGGPCNQLYGWNVLAEYSAKGHDCIQRLWDGIGLWRMEREAYSCRPQDGRENRCEPGCKEKEGGAHMHWGSNGMRQMVVG